MEIAGERPVHGFHVQMVTVNYPRLRLYSIAFLLTAIVVSLSGFVWKISIEKQPSSTSIGTTEKPPTTPAKKSVIYLELALITTIHRIKDPDTQGYMKADRTI